MKNQIAPALLLLLLPLGGCGGPEEGPMGIHVGDYLSAGPRRSLGKVLAVSEDWVETAEQGRLHIDKLKLIDRLKVNCQHKD